MLGQGQGAVNVLLTIPFTPSPPSQLDPLTPLHIYTCTILSIFSFSDIHLVPSHPLSTPLHWKLSLISNWSFQSSNKRHVSPPIFLSPLQYQSGLPDYQCQNPNLPDEFPNEPVVGSLYSILLLKPVDFNKEKLSVAWQNEEKNFQV